MSGDVPNDPFVIPQERLPPGFAEQIERPPAVAVEPKPAATAVLIRDGDTGLEVLLLKRHRASGFVPGAYVFPGGRVDAADAQVFWPVKTPEPSAEYWVAAIREIFEETGVLLARDRAGAWAASSAQDAQLEAWRERLLGETAGLQELIDGERFTLAADSMVYIAHWITPVAEPRRYDTRFFLAGLPPGAEVKADPREMTDAVWLTPASALARFEAGNLPMVFPTVKTLQLLAPYVTVADALQDLNGRTVQPILPRLVRTGTGVGLVIEE